jgi:hypothetical protein
MPQATTKAAAQQPRHELKDLRPRLLRRAELPLSAPWRAHTLISYGLGGASAPGLQQLQQSCPRAAVCLPHAPRTRTVLKRAGPYTRTQCP